MIGTIPSLARYKNHLTAILLLAPIAVAEAQDLSVSSAPPPSQVSAPAPACTPPPKDPALWDKSITGGYNYTDGNSKTSSLNLNGKLGRDYQEDAWQFEIDYNRGDAAATTDDPRVVTKDNARGKADYKRVFDDTWFAAIGSSIFHDEIADLKYRAILNPGIGAYLARTEDLKFSLETGPAYVWEKKGDISDSYLAARFADGFSWKISDTARVFQSAEYLISTDDSKNYIVTAEVGLEAALTSLVNIVFIVRDNYVNVPAAGLQQNDVQTITGLKINL
jgi:putative salt-induced outer membrane protein YdiY